MPRRLAEMAHARPIGPAPAMMAVSCCMDLAIYSQAEACARLAGIGVAAEQLVQALPEIWPDRIDEVIAIRRQHVLNIDRIEAGDAGLFDHINEMQAGFLDEGPELVRPAF